jgi:hypothetical protein
MRKALSKLALRDWILLKLDMSNAPRPSELFAPKWGLLASDGFSGFRRGLP